MENKITNRKLSINNEPSGSHDLFDQIVITLYQRNDTPAFQWKDFHAFQFQFHRKCKNKPRRFKSNSNTLFDRCAILVLKSQFGAVQKKHTFLAVLHNVLHHARVGRNSSEPIVDIAA